MLHRWFRTLVFTASLFAIIGLVAHAADPVVVPFTPELPAAPDDVHTVVLDEVGLALDWSHDGSDLHLTMTGSAESWMSVGFVGLNGRMNGANMLLLRFDGEEWTVENHVGAGLNHRQAAWPEKASYTIQETEETVSAIIQYPLAFPDGFGLAGLDVGVPYTLIAAVSDRSGLRNHGRDARTSLAFILQEEE